MISTTVASRLVHYLLLCKLSMSFNINKCRSCQSPVFVITTQLSLPQARKFNYKRATFRYVCKLYLIVASYALQFVNNRQEDYYNVYECMPHNYCLYRRITSHNFLFINFKHFKSPSQNPLAKNFFCGISCFKLRLCNSERRKIFLLIFIVREKCGDSRSL